MKFRIGDKVQLSSNLPCDEEPKLGLVAGVVGCIVRSHDADQYFDVAFETGTYTFYCDNITGTGALTLGTSYLEVIDGDL